MIAVWECLNLSDRTLSGTRAPCSARSRALRVRQDERPSTGGHAQVRTWCRRVGRCGQVRPGGTGGVSMVPLGTRAPSCGPGRGSRAASRLIMRRRNLRTLRLCRSNTLTSVRWPPPGRQPPSGAAPPQRLPRMLGRRGLGRASGPFRGHPVGLVPCARRPDLWRAAVCGRPVSWASWCTDRPARYRSATNASSCARRSGVCRILAVPTSCGSTSRVGSDD